jgi:precorrin-6x reductase
VEVPDVDSAVDWLQNQKGNILLTTGSKDLGTFARLEDYRERVYPRILPNLDSLSHALELGYPGKHLICMQGPFSEALNTALLQQIGATVLVTKDTGTVGGFEEKVRAARAAGAKLLVIRRPSAEQGWTVDALLERFGDGKEAKR